MNRLISTLCAVAITSLAYADNFTSANINFTTTSETTVEVAPGEYTGTVSIPKSVTYAGNTYAVTGIGKDAFRNLAEVTAVELPDGLEYLDENCFRLSGISECRLPGTLKTIYGGAFNECKGLESLTIPASVEVIEGCLLKDCEKMTEITLPATIKKFSFHQAFYGCASLKTINIEFTTETTTDIDGRLALGQLCFRNCPNLEAVNMKSVTPPIIKSGNEFLNIISSKMKFYVPKGSKAAYVTLWGSASRSFIEEEGESALKATSNDKRRNDGYDYDLNGRRANDSHKGMRIRNGKLILKK